jgi:hypothetical protein
MMVDHNIDKISIHFDKTFFVSLLQNCIHKEVTYVFSSMIIITKQAMYYEIYLSNFCFMVLKR